MYSLTRRLESQVSEISLVIEGKKMTCICSWMRSDAGYAGYTYAGICSLVLLVPNVLPCHEPMNSLPSN
jgi:hypothetical protein